MKLIPLRPAPALLAALGLILALPANAGGIAYVSNQKGNITTIDLESFATRGEIDVGGASPRGLGVTADGKLLVVAARDKGDLAVVELATGNVVKRIPIGKNPEFVRVRGDRAFVSFEPASAGGPPPRPGSREAEELRQKRADDQERLTATARAASRWRRTAGPMSPPSSSATSWSCSMPASTW